ncbi:MAG: hypothetical protein U0797_06885 [Gemmataceae bacterium]
MRWHISLLGLSGWGGRSRGPAGRGTAAAAGLVRATTATGAADYEAFLKKHFAKVAVAPRKGFDPAAARDADVVLLDWSQSEGSVDKATSPLGKLEGWTKPTVLLGSAGLFMAGQWQLIGGAG